MLIWSPLLGVDRLGGHIVSGHVDGLGTVENIEKLEKSWLLSIKWKNNNFSKYVVNKGSICVNGISLTIAKYEQEGNIYYCDNSSYLA